MSHRRPVALAAALLLVTAFSPRLLRAEGRSENWQTYCTVCHGDDGRAQTEEGKKKHARDLTNAKWQARQTDAELEKSVTKGKGKMPAFGKKLSEDEIKALVKEARSMAATGDAKSDSK